MKLICAGMTDVGRTREHNEDDFYLSDGREALCIVADGMGGHRSGEVASAMAIKAIVEYYRETMTDDDDEAESETEQAEAEINERRLQQAVQAANKSVFKAASQSELYRGMGTTIVSGYFTEGTLYLAHIGDSRAYRYRDGELAQCTEDHSLANEYVRMGILSDEEVEYFPYKNVITRACGLTDEVEVDVGSRDLEVGDLYLFCTDGLTDMVRDGALEELLEEEDDLENLCKTLVARANENGGADNITVVVARVSE
ncbi:MAG: Stp1/IreP family PP2C-type Ser/Thr phosphatase [Myxococcota bacterium]